MPEQKKIIMPEQPKNPAGKAIMLPGQPEKHGPGRKKKIGVERWPCGTIKQEKKKVKEEAEFPKPKAEKKKVKKKAESPKPKAEKKKVKKETKEVRGESLDASRRTGATRGLEGARRRWEFGERVPPRSEPD